MKNREISIVWIKILVMLCRLVLGGIFIYASLDKIIHPEAFSYIIYRYHLLPSALITPLALLLPWVELFTGLFLIAGFYIRSSAFVLSSLLVGFMIALSINAIRGLDVSCGCFATSAEQREPAIRLVFRDTLILIPGIFILLFHRSTYILHASKKN